jgi:Zn-dependent protease with chaperone function
MNFFEHQHRARRKTWLLVSYFLLAVVLIVLAVNLAVFVAFYLTIGETASQFTTFQGWFKSTYAFWTTAATFAVIVLGTLSTLLKLRGGGRVVAHMVGARLVDPNTRDLNERRLINIVEEMSIASGTPVPELYVLEDNAINAFVAGYRPTEAVLVVTGGALESFNRDELQGVIGHEYSHVFNGDMRINIRLMGVLAGILMIGQIGRFLLRSGGRSRSGRGKGGGQVAVLGLGLLLIGYIGLFFGSLIKAAISRQREFLADASSVQFTRNPDGIAGALWIIKEHTGGSRLLNARAEDISHFCFSDAIGSKFTSWMATHPPLEQRIKAIHPYFDIKKRVQWRRELDATTAAASTGAGAAAGAPAAGTAFAVDAAVAAALTGSSVGATIGQGQARHLSYAERLHAAIPEPLAAAARDRTTVRPLIYALILADMQDHDRPLGLNAIKQSNEPGLVDAVNRFCVHAQQAGARFRLPLINMSVPALKSLGWEERARFLTLLEDVIKADKRYTIFEFTLLTILREHLAEDAGRDLKEKYFKYSDVLREINLILSILARIGAGKEDQALAIHAAIMKHFDTGPIAMAEKAECKLTAVGAALQKLNLLSPRLKQTVIESFADCVIHDGKVVPAEAELLQAIAISLDSPMPPLTA